VYCLTGELDAPFPDCFVARVERLRSPSTPPPPPALESGGAYPFLLQEQLLQTYRRYAERNIQMLANPYPRYLIWETTRNCNLACAHCAVPRTTWEAARELTTEQAKSVFSQLAADYPPSSVQMLALSGGEPLLRGDLVEMVGFLTALGYPVGLDSNGLLLGRRPDLLDRLVAAGLKYPCLSLDGLKSSHDGLRGAPCHDEVVSAISHIIRKHPQVPLQTITMVTPFNIDELDGIAALLDSLGVRRARFSTVYRSGRAKEHPENCLDDPGHARLLRWIAGMRRRFFDGETPLLVEFTDDGWCGRAIDGVGLEGLVRNSLFFCQAGISLAVINYDGGLSACMSLPEERSRQGSLLDESFRTIWESRFRSFRDRGRLWRDACVACTEWNFCLGGAMHHRAADGALQECPHLRLQRGAGGCR